MDTVPIRTKCITLKRRSRASNRYAIDVLVELTQIIFRLKNFMIFAVRQAFSLVGWVFAKKTQM